MPASGDFATQWATQASTSDKKIHTIPELPHQKLGRLRYRLWFQYLKSQGYWQADTKVLMYGGAHHNSSLA